MVLCGRESYLIMNWYVKCMMFVVFKCCLKIFKVILIWDLVIKIVNNDEIKFVIIIS